jgi:TP901 family phage tail tape measure protein
VADNYSVAYMFEAIDKMSQNLNTIKKNVKGLDGAFSGAGNKAKTFSQKMSMAGNKLKNIGNRMRYMSLAATGAGVASVVAFSKMEDGLLNVQGLLEREDLPKYTGKLKKLQAQAIRTGFGIDDANKGLFDTISALGIGEQSIKTFQAAQKLAIGGAADLSVAVDGLTSIVNAYGRKTTNVSDVANAFYSSQVKGKTTVSELASEVGKVAPIAKAAGVGFKELLATTAALTTGGLRTDMATTALRAALSALAKPGAQARKILERLGIAHGRTQLKAVGLKNVLLQIIEANKKYPEALDVAIPNIRAATGLFALNAEKIALLDETLLKVSKDIENGTGLQDSYNRKMQATQQQLRMLRGNLSIVGNIIGSELAPFVSKLNSGFTKLVDRFQKMSPVTRKVIVGIGALIAVLTPLAISLGFVAIALSAITLPIVLISAGVIALGAGIAALIIYWDDLVESMKGAYSWLVNFGEKISGVRFDPLGLAKQEMEIKRTSKVIGESSPSKNEFAGKLDVFLNAPKETIKNYSSVTEGTGFNLGVNMGH